MKLIRALQYLCERVWKIMPTVLYNLTVCDWKNYDSLVIMQSCSTLRNNRNSFACNWLTKDPSCIRNVGLNEDKRTLGFRSQIWGSSLLPQQQNTVYGNYHFLNIHLNYVLHNVVKFLGLLFFSRRSYVQIWLMILILLRKSSTHKAQFVHDQLFAHFPQFIF
jgi:hypothetical protein